MVSSQILLITGIDITVVRMYICLNVCTYCMYDNVCVIVCVYVFQFLDMYVHTYLYYVYLSLVSVAMPTYTSTEKCYLSW